MAIRYKPRYWNPKKYKNGIKKSDYICLTFDISIYFLNLHKRVHRWTLRKNEGCSTEIDHTIKKSELWKHESNLSKIEFKKNNIIVLKGSGGLYFRKVNFIVFN